MSYRKLTPSDVISRILQGYAFSQYKMKRSSKEWETYVLSEGISLKRANELIRVADRLYRDPIRDQESLRRIALLQIPWEVLVDACAKSVTSEQLQAFFDLCGKQDQPQRLAQSEFRGLLRSILHPSSRVEILHLPEWEELLEEQPETQLERLAVRLGACVEDLQSTLRKMSSR